jgi:hypothetical protein
MNVPSEQIRDLVNEAESRGSPMVSAQAMQMRLFSIYDAVSEVPDALALVQHQLGLTLDRNWYSPQEVSRLADDIDGALSLSV